MSLKTLTEKIIQYVDEKISRSGGSDELNELLEAAKGNYFGNLAASRDFNTVNGLLSNNLPSGMIPYLYEIDKENSTIWREPFPNTDNIKAYICVKILTFQEVSSGVKCPILRKAYYSFQIDETTSWDGTKEYDLVPGKTLARLDTYIMYSNMPKLLMSTRYTDTVNVVYLGSPIIENSLTGVNINDAQYIWAQYSNGNIRTLDEVSPLELYNGFIKEFTEEEREVGYAYGASAIPTEILNTKINTQLVNLIFDFDSLTIR